MRPCVDRRSAKTSAKPCKTHIIYATLVLISAGFDFPNVMRGANAEGVATVSTVAGGGPAALVDGNGTDARFNQPFGVATFPNGDLVVADSANNAIRYMTVAGVVSTLAGRTQGAADGTGTAASFYSPRGIATTSNGDIVVVDHGNNAIRYITAAGGVSTLAGGTGGAQDGAGTTARFANPVGIATLPNGDMVVADTWNHAIRYITAVGRVVSTMAGLKGFPGALDGSGTAARFRTPHGIATFLNGDMVVADHGNHAIRYITAAGRVVSTLAGGSPSGFADGTGTAARFTSPHGIATLPNGDIVVADTGNNAIRYITAAGGVVSTLAGASPTGLVDGTGTAARFTTPVGVASFTNGDIVVADFSNQAIRYISMPKPATNAPMPTCPQDMCKNNGTVVPGRMNGTAQNCSCDCLPGYDPATNCSSKLLCPESMCSGNGNATGNILDGCACVCFAAYDNRTNCSMPLPCPNSTCHDKGNVSGNLQIGCSCECEPGYNASTNCSTPLECPSSMCNGNGNATGNILNGCGCTCLAAYDNGTNCSTPLPCPNSTCHGKGSVLGNLLIGCNCSCDAGFDPETNCSTVLTAVPVTPTNTSVPLTSSPTTELPSAAPPSTNTTTLEPTAAPPEFDCGLGLLFNTSAVPLLDPEYEQMWTQTNASTESALPCDSEWNCATAMKNCAAVVVASNSSCDAAGRCTRQYVSCLFRAAQNSSGSAGCPRLQLLNASLREGTMRRDDTEFEQRMVQRCSISTCRILSYVTGRSCTLNSTALACPSPEATVLQRPRKPAAMNVVSTIVGRTAATAIVSTTTSGTAVAALISSPSAATKVPALASLTQVIQCAFSEDDTEPSPFDFPVPVSIGSSPFAKYVGSGLITILCLVVLPVLGTLLLGHVARGAGRTVRLLQKKVFANGAMLTLGYFGPLAFKLPILIIWHSKAEVDVVIALLCPLLVLCLVLYLLFAIVRRFDSAVIVVTPSDDGDASELEFSNKDPNGLYVETFGLLLEPCRSTRLRHRLLYFEDFLVAALLQLIDGVRPERENSCGAEASLMGVLCWMHTLYLVIVRPYGDRLELVLVIIGSLLMSAMATLGLIITLTVPAANMTESPEFAVFAYLGLATTIWFFAQSCVLGLAVIVDANKKAFVKRIGVEAKNGASLDVGEVPSSGPNGPYLPKPQSAVLSSASILSPLQRNPQGVLETPLLLASIDRLHRPDGDSSVFNPLAC